MEFFKVLASRHSCRAFKHIPIDDQYIKSILESAQTAPSAGNLQSYAIYMIAAPGALGDLVYAAERQSFINEAPLVLIFCACPAISKGRYGDRGEFLYSVQDATIACAYAQLAATALGLASVWVGAFNEDLVCKLLGLRKEHFPIAILPIGEKAEELNVRLRRPPSEVIFSVNLPLSDDR